MTALEGLGQLPALLGDRKGWPGEGREKAGLTLAGRMPGLGREQLEEMEWKRIRMDCRG